MARPSLFAMLVQALQCQPGIGPKSAQRIALHLLERDRDGAHHLAQVLEGALIHIGHCQQCRGLAETELCEICVSPRRDERLLCVVEGPADVVAIEAAGFYRGKYFVLGGKLSPLDGIGPRELRLHELESRLKLTAVAEMILATSTSVEGEATAAYLNNLARGIGVQVTRIAQGVPQGGELEYLDGGTLNRAFDDRRTY